PATVWFEWGIDNSYGNLTPPVTIGPGSKVVRVSQPTTGLTPSASYHYRAAATNVAGIAFGAETLLTTGMNIQNWGIYLYGLPTIPLGLTNLVMIACGHGHCLAIRDDGTVVAWWAGFTNIVATDYGQVIVPAGLSNVISIAGGFSHSLAAREDGTVVAWGKFWSGASISVPANATNVVAIAGGDSHCVALRADGTVVAWGDNGSGQTSIPPAATNIVAI